VISLDSGHVLFAHNAERLFLPASNAKLFTAALALDRLGPEYRIRTSLYASSPPMKGGRLKGDLIAYGRGDPTLTARFHGGDLELALAPLADALAAAGVKRVQGNLIADESFFRGPALGAGWGWDDLQYYYGAEASALSINDNALEVIVKPGAQVGTPAGIELRPQTTLLSVSNRITTTPAASRRDLRLDRPPGRNVLYLTGTIPLNDKGYTESVSVTEPARWFGLILREALRRRGITVDGQVRAVSWLDREALPLDTPSLVELGGLDSPPLSDLLGRMLKPSQNLYAQLLLLQVGAAGLAQKERPPALEPESSRPTVAAGPGGTPNRARTAEEAGLRALDGLLAEAGIEPGEVLLEEGAGLSRRDLVSPAAVIKLLQFMARHPHAKVFYDALPLAGVEGTLKNRMKDSPAAANARAKTGTLNLVYSLSGYVTSAAGERLAFAIFLNHYRSRNANQPARADLDALVVTLAGLTWRSSAAAD
jgi:D-alanyl-D-alanine carboxypeptidase/D-alanyl-D-alanine-endopeptidase (penicillin-binding protein 4)